MAGKATKQQQTGLATLRNVGRAALADFAVLGIETVAQLAQADASELYLRLQTLTGQRHDPCVWDVFAATIHQAKTGEALDWWHFTPKRKLLARQGRLPVYPPASKPGNE